MLFLSTSLYLQVNHGVVVVVKEVVVVVNVVIVVDVGFFIKFRLDRFFVVDLLLFWKLWNTQAKPKRGSTGQILDGSTGQILVV